MTHRPRFLRPFATLVVLVLIGPTCAAYAAELQEQTLEAWNRYVRRIEARIAREVAASDTFLWKVDQRALRAGDVVVEQVRPGETADIDVPGGTIHHWRGAVFIPNVTLADLLADLRSTDPGRHLQSDVLAWRLISRDGDAERVFLKLVRKELVTVTYNTTHEVQYHWHGPTRATSSSASVKIAELEDAGTPREHEKPVGNDRGFLWRLNSYWRYEQVPGPGSAGVVVQLESVTLSRAIPLLLKPIARPLIGNIANESIERTLDSLRQRLKHPLRLTSG